MKLSAIGSWLIALVVGGVYGAAGSVAQSYLVWGIPVGLILSVAACAAILIGVRLLTEDRWSTLATGVGMVLVVLVLSGEGPGGSVLLTQTLPATVWTLIVPVVVALVVAWPSARGGANVRGTDAGSDAHDGSATAN